MRKLFLMVAWMLCTCCLAIPASAVEIMPTGYRFDQSTDKGSYTYNDWTGMQLIDGQYGINPWTADLGSGNAYEWVGWVNDPIVNIDFNFLTVTKIDNINVGTVQDDPTDVVVPNVEIYQWTGGSWSFVTTLMTPESSLNNNQYFTLSLTNLNIQTDRVRVTLKHSNNGPWTFTDEIDFYSNRPSAVPVPCSIILLGIGLISISGIRRKKS